MATITEDYVSFEVAKLLKEKGFNEPVTELNRLLFKEGKKPVLEITHQKAMKWLREVHNIAIETLLLSCGWFCQIEKISEGFCKEYIDETDGYKTYEEAVEAALKYSLENLI